MEALAEMQGFSFPLKHSTLLNIVGFWNFWYFWNFPFQILGAYKPIPLPPNENRHKGNNKKKYHKNCTLVLCSKK